MTLVKERKKKEKTIEIINVDLFYPSTSERKKGGKKKKIALNSHKPGTI